MRANRLFMVMFLVIGLCIPAMATADKVTVEGTVQGLLSTCEARMCTPGEEAVIAAIEDTYVLVAKPGDYYLLPNIRSSMLSRYLGDTVKVTGQTKLDGRAIMVEKAEVMIDGNWLPFFSPEIMQLKQAKEKGYYTP